MREIASQLGIADALDLGPIAKQIKDLEERNQASMAAEDVDIPDEFMDPIMCRAGEDGGSEELHCARSG